MLSLQVQGFRILVAVFFAHVTNDRVAYELHARSRPQPQIRPLAGYNFN
jgi:hypothetical protein